MANACGVSVAHLFQTIVSGFDRADSIAVDELKGFVYWVQRQANDDDAATVLHLRAIYQF